MREPRTSGSARGVCRAIGIPTATAVNAAVGFWQECKASSALEALKKQLALRCRVRRDGQWQELDASQLVLGDIVRVRLGGHPARRPQAPGGRLSQRRPVGTHRRVAAGRAQAR